MNIYILLYVTDPVIELIGGPDPCQGQVIIRGGVYVPYRGEAILCDKEAPLEMANVICHQVGCGPPEANPPFEHRLK